MRRALPVILFSAFLVIAVASGAPQCPGFTSYIGNDIYVYVDSKYVEVRAWFSPMDIDWWTFRSECFDPNPDYWYQALVNRVAAMFGLSKSEVIASGIDDGSGEVYVWVGFYMSWSSYYDSENEVLKFRDPFKPLGGFFDEVHVYSDRYVYDWYPTPDYYSDTEAHWYNYDYDSAPDWYYIYLKCMCTAEVRIVGLPSSLSTTVKVNGAYAGSLAGEGTITVSFECDYAEVEVSDVLTYGSGARYVVDDSEKTVYCGSTVTFYYHAEYLVSLESEPLAVEVEVNGVEHRMPYSFWVEKGDTVTVEVPDSVTVASTSTVREYYVFEGWSDGETGRRRVLTVNAPVSLTARYEHIKEYYVSVKANPSEASKGVKGSGWYREGSTALISAKDTVYVSDYERLEFVSWSSGATSSTLRVTVDRPMTFQANYAWVYKVEVSTPYGGTSGSGWYRKGSTAVVKILGLREGYYYEDGDRVRHKFLGWAVEKGGVSVPASETVTFTVESPVILKAVFGKAEYEVCIDEVCSYYEEGATLPQKPNIPVLDGLIVEVFEGYRDEEGNFLGSEVVVDRPMVLESVYREDYTGSAAVSLLVVLSAAIYTWRRVKAIRRQTAPAKRNKTT